MEKKRIIIIALSVILVLTLLVIIYGYFQGQALVSRMNQLESDRQRLSSEKEQILSESEQCRSDNQDLNSKLSMLQEDVGKIYRGCIADNACKGHYPGIRWNCNNVGDETNLNPSHVCVCDTSCNLAITPINR